MPARMPDAYSRYKAQTDALLDFAVLVSHSIPVLRDSIAKLKSGAVAALPKPDFFHKSTRSNPGDLLKTEAHYETYLASYVLLAHFSFFESLVDNLITELFEIHGGEEKFIQRIRNRTRRLLSRQTAEGFQGKRRLQESENPRFRDAYRKHSRDFDEAGFRFPGELLAAYGVRCLVENTRKLKAVNIPVILTEGFQMDLSKSEVDHYHKIRETRNRIAHGDPVTITMKEAVVMNGELRKLALKVSVHVAEHFFVIEKYVPGNPFSI
jgi:RiboL-PSP-HEPN